MDDNSKADFPLHHLSFMTLGLHMAGLYAFHFALVPGWKPRNGNLPAGETSVVLPKLPCLSHGGGTVANMPSHATKGQPFALPSQG